MKGPRSSGRLIAIWGGYGSPGRTTVAIALARVLGSKSEPALLIDADTYGADVGHVLSLAAGPTIANAVHRCRHREAGEIFPALATSLASGTDVLPGISHPGLWRDLARPQIQCVLRSAASVYTYVVIDTSPCIEASEGCASRNIVTRTVLSAADQILLLCRADPAGIQSFAGAFEELTDDLNTEIAKVAIVVNRLPVRSAGRRMIRLEREIQEITGLRPLAWLTEDPAVISALWAGRTVYDHAPKARFARQILELAACLGHIDTREVSA